MKKIWYLIVILVFFTVHSFANLLMTRDEALKVAFPEADSVEKIDIFINDKQAREIESLAKTKLDSKIFIFYEFKNEGEILGYAVLDTHLLRTKSETVMYVISRDGKLINAEILAFFEPTEYMQSENWLELFKNKALTNDLRIDRDIPNITGATITSHAFTESVRKILAIYNISVKGDPI